MPLLNRWRSLSNYQKAAGNSYRYIVKLLFILYLSDVSLVFSLTASWLLCLAMALGWTSLVSIRHTFLVHIMEITCVNVTWTIRVPHHQRMTHATVMFSQGQLPRLLHINKTDLYVTGNEKEFLHGRNAVEKTKSLDQALQCNTPSGTTVNKINHFRTKLILCM